MFVRPSRGPVAVVSVLFVCLLPAAVLAVEHRGERVAVPHGPSVTFSIGHGASSASSSASFRLRDFSHGHDLRENKALGVPATPKPTETAYPSFANPLHRHRMAFIAF